MYFIPYKMELPNKLLEQIAFNTRSKIIEHMLIVIDKSIDEEHLFQPLQTNIKQFKKAVTFLTGYKGIFNVTNSNNKFYSMKSISDEDGYLQITIPPGAFEIESLNNELKRNFIDEEHYPFTKKLNFSTLGSIIEISPHGPIISFMFDDSIRDLLGFNARALYEEYTLLNNPVDILSFDNIFNESHIAQGLIFRRKRSGTIHNFSMDIDPGYKNIETFHGGVQW